MRNWNTHVTYFIRGKRLSGQLLLPQLLLVLTLSSCATDSERAGSEGALLGGLVGGVIGNVLDDERGAMVGAFFGSMLGSKWGTHVASKKAEYESQEAYLGDVIAAAEKVASDAESYNKMVSNRIVQLEQREKELKISKATYQEQQIQLKKFESELELALNKTNTNIEVVAREIEIQNRVIAEEKSSADPQFVKVATGGISDLEIQQRALRRALAQLNRIDERRVY